MLVLITGIRGKTAKRIASWHLRKGDTVFGVDSKRTKFGTYKRNFVFWEIPGDESYNQILFVPFHRIYHMSFWDVPFERRYRSFFISQTQHVLELAEMARVCDSEFIFPTITGDDSIFDPEFCMKQMAEKQLQPYIHYTNFIIMPFLPHMKTKKSTTEILISVKRFQFHGSRSTE